MPVRWCVCVCDRERERMVQQFANLLILLNFGCDDIIDMIRINGDLIVNKYISIPQDLREGGLNTAAFAAGMVNGILDAAEFVSGNQPFCFVLFFTSSTSSTSSSSVSQFVFVVQMLHF